MLCQRRVVHVNLRAGAGVPPLRVCPEQHVGARGDVHRLPVGGHARADLRALRVQGDAHDPLVRVVRGGGVVPRDVAPQVVDARPNLLRVGVAHVQAHDVHPGLHQLGDVAGVLPALPDRADDGGLAVPAALGGKQPHIVLHGRHVGAPPVPVAAHGAWDDTHRNAEPAD